MGRSSGYDPYPKFTQEDLGWFRDLVVQIAKKPEHVIGVGRRRAGLDLELVMDIAPASRELFTAKVCAKLEKKVKKRSGVDAPLVYEINQPHARARELLDYAARGY